MLQQGRSVTQLLGQVGLFERYKIRRVASGSHNTTKTVSDSTCRLRSLVLLVMVELFGRRKTGSKRVPEYYLHRKWLNLLVKLFSITSKGGVIGEAKDKTGIKRVPQY